MNDELCVAEGPCTKSSCDTGCWYKSSTGDWMEAAPTQCTWSETKQRCESGMNDEVCVAEGPCTKSSCDTGCWYKSSTGDWMEAAPTQCTWSETKQRCES